MIDLAMVSPCLLDSVVSCEVGDVSVNTDHRPVFVRMCPVLEEPLAGTAAAHVEEGPQHEAPPRELEDALLAHSWPRLRDLPPPPRRNWSNPLGVPTRFEFLPPFAPIAAQTARLQALACAPPGEARAALTGAVDDTLRALSDAIWELVPPGAVKAGGGEGAAKVDRPKPGKPKHAWFDGDLCRLRAQARAIERSSAHSRADAHRAWGRYKRACESRKWE